MTFRRNRRRFVPALDALQLRIAPTVYLPADSDGDPVFIPPSGSETGLMCSPTAEEAQDAAVSDS